MNKQKKKCEHLKQIRKNVADAIGVELNQSICTFEGECKGTCPKCEQEERKLSKALLVKGTAVAASAAMLLTGCATEPDVLAGDMPNPEFYEDELEGETTMADDDDEPIMLEGDMEYIGEEDE